MVVGVVERALLVSQSQCEQREHGHLPRKSLGACHAYLRAHMDVDAGVGLAGYRRAHCIDDAENQRPLLLGQFYGCQRVGGLAALADGYHHIFGLYHGIYVSELAGVFHFHRYAAKRLYQLLADESGVP